VKLVEGSGLLLLLLFDKSAGWVGTELADGRQEVSVDGVTRAE
jgi:hypothetical protein